MTSELWPRPLLILRRLQRGRRSTTLPLTGTKKPLLHPSPARRKRTQMDLLCKHAVKSARVNVHTRGGRSFGVRVGDKPRLAATLSEALLMMRMRVTPPSHGHVCPGRGRGCWDEGGDTLVCLLQGGSIFSMLSMLSPSSSSGRTTKSSRAQTSSALLSRETSGKQLCFQMGQAQQLAALRVEAP